MARIRLEEALALGLIPPDQVDALMQRFPAVGRSQMFGSPLFIRPSTGAGALQRGLFGFGPYGGLQSARFGLGPLLQGMGLSPPPSAVTSPGMVPVGAAGRRRQELTPEELLALYQQMARAGALPRPTIAPQVERLTRPLQILPRVAQQIQQAAGPQGDDVAGALAMTRRVLGITQNVMNDQSLVRAVIEPILGINQLGGGRATPELEQAFQTQRAGERTLPFFTPSLGAGVSDVGYVPGAFAPFAAPPSLPFSPTSFERPAEFTPMNFDLTYPTAPQVPADLSQGGVTALQGSEASPQAGGGIGDVLGLGLGLAQGGRSLSQGNVRGGVADIVQGLPGAIRIVNSLLPTATWAGSAAETLASLGWTAADIAAAGGVEAALAISAPAIEAGVGLGGAGAAAGAGLSAVGAFAAPVITLGTLIAQELWGPGGAFGGPGISELEAQAAEKAAQTDLAAMASAQQRALRGEIAPQQALSLLSGDISMMRGRNPVRSGFQVPLDVAKSMGLPVREPSEWATFATPAMQYLSGTEGAAIDPISGIELPGTGVAYSDRPYQPPVSERFNLVKGSAGSEINQWSPTASTPGRANQVTGDWAALTPEQFTTFMTQYAQRPDVFSKYVQGSGDVAYLPQDQAQAVAAQAQQATIDFLNQLTSGVTAPPLPSAPPPEGAAAPGEKQAGLEEKSKSAAPQSFQSGGIVPRTGTYKIHRGERVLSERSVGPKPLASMQSGGFVPRTGMYTLHQGETVVPAGQTAHSAQPAEPSQEMHAYLALNEGGIQWAKKNPDAKKFWRLAFTPQEGRVALLEGKSAEIPVVVPQAITRLPGVRMVAAVEAARRAQHQDPTRTLGDFLSPAVSIAPPLFDVLAKDPEELRYYDDQRHQPSPLGTRDTIVPLTPGPFYQGPKSMPQPMTPGLRESVGVGI